MKTSTYSGVLTGKNGVTIQEAIGRVLRDEREHRGITTGDLGRKMGFAESSIRGGNWNQYVYQTECGYLKNPKSNRHPSGLSLWKFVHWCRALGIDPGEALKKAMSLMGDAEAEA